MPQGFQVFSENGDIIFDENTATAEYLGDGYTNGANGSLTNSRINNRKVWITVCDIPTPDAAFGVPIPRFRQSGNTISWEVKPGRTPARPKNIHFIYGVINY